MQHDPTFWLIARAAGVTAYLLMSASVVFGLLLSGRPLGKLVRPKVITEVHRTLTITMVAALAAHAAALVADASVHVPVAGIVVPGLVDYRPVWTAAGVVAADLAVAVWLSFPLRRHIGVKVWRKLHVATFAVFLLATAHGLLAGTDSVEPWAQAMYQTTMSLVVGLTAWRVLNRRRSPARAPQRQRPAVPAAQAANR